MDSMLPNLRSLHDPRHPGLTQALCYTYAEATEVCLARHHEPPQTGFHIECRGQSAQRLVVWNWPSPAALRAYNNRDDTTRDAAYIVSIAAVEAQLGLVTLLRAETRTGADYYVGDPAAEDIENAYRLEVSGVDAGGPTALRYRLREKVEQARNGLSNLPAYASVVGFREAKVLISEVDEVA